MQKMCKNEIKTRIENLENGIKDAQEELKTIEVQKEHYLYFIKVSKRKLKGLKAEYGKEIS